MRHGVDGQFAQRPWEASVPQQELQQDREAQPRRAGLVAQEGIV